MLFQSMLIWLRFQQRPSVSSYLIKPWLQNRSASKWNLDWPWNAASVEDLATHYCNKKGRFWLNQRQTPLRLHPKYSNSMHFLVPIESICHWTGNDLVDCVHWMSTGSVAFGRIQKIINIAPKICYWICGVASKPPGSRHATMSQEELGFTSPP